MTHDLGATVAGEDWRRRAAEADKSGEMMKELLKQAQFQQALFEVATASKRTKSMKPGWRLQERDRKNLEVAVESNKHTTYVDVHKIVSPDSSERMLYCLLGEGWLDEHDAYGWTSLMHAVEAGKDDHVAALLRAGAQKDKGSTQVYGNHPKGVTAVDVARRMQDELGIDRAEIIKQLEYEPAKDVEVTSEGKLNVGLLGRLKKKKMAAQAQVTIDQTMGYKTGGDAEKSGASPAGAKKAGGGGWGKLGSNLGKASGKKPDFGDVAAAAIGINLADMQKQVREHQAASAKNTDTAQGYELATQVIHVGSIVSTHAIPNASLISREIF